MSAKEIVRHFLKDCSVEGGLPLAFRDYFTSDCLYENVGLSKTTGPAEAIAFVESFASRMPFHTFTVEMLRIIEEGPIVMTERIDHFHDQSGKVFFSIPVMGVFELRGEKICLWRDYADLTAFKDN
jgi:limonene-1,2-epoxide hydrolase